MAADKDSLLAELKNYLDITWEDEKEDQKIQGMMERGMAAISGRIGECDFYGETEEKTLLFTYVMYERAGDLDLFWANYKSEILLLQIDRRVERYAEEERPAV